MIRARLALVLFGLAACDPPSAGVGAPASATVASSAAAPPPTAKVEAPPSPDDLPVAELQQHLACGGGSKTGPCAVLAAFAAPCTAWNATSPSGDARWMGRGHEVENGKVTEKVTLLRLRRVPAEEVGPGQIPAKLGIAELLPDDPAHRAAQQAIRAFERNDVAGKTNAGLEHVKQRADWSEAFATHTRSRQVYALAHGGTFVCQGQGQRLLLVQRAGSRTSKGDGLYAELWPVTW